jgi:prepilin-type N-terminal cleavage/methylation domain-containing protein/prepilin-type processing-associated H-X9-DG protein
MQRKSGFTLVELLVVIGIIAILMMLVAPQIGSALGKARDTACKSNMKQIQTAAAAFTTDNNGVLASAWSRGSSSSNDAQMCFVGKEVTPGSVVLNSDWPKGKYGSLVNYIGGAPSGPRLYRCPGLNRGVLRSGTGSNGYFDYVMLEVFAGAKKSYMPTRATVNLGAGDVSVPCPWLTEEDPAEFLNAGFMQPFHKSTDRMGAWHNGRANVGAADGSVQSFTSTMRVKGLWKNPMCSEWKARPPSGKPEISLNSPAVSLVDGWGWWNRQ